MNRGLLLKSFVDARAVTVLLATALLLVEAVLSYVLPTIMVDFSSQILQVPFIRTMNDTPIWLGRVYGCLSQIERFP